MRVKKLVTAGERLCEEGLGSPVLQSFFVQLDHQPFRSLPVVVRWRRVVGVWTRVRIVPGPKEVLVLWVGGGGGGGKARLPAT